MDGGIMIKIPSCTLGTRKETHSWCGHLRFVEEGCKARLGTKDSVVSDLYSAMLPAYCWDPSSAACHRKHGAVFNLEFSPDGSLLVAACEKKSVLVLDPLRGTLVNRIDDAHDDCVNCVKFLDSRMFATCSDDNTVSIWDIRFLRNKIRSLKGHANWVKNIEYAHDVGLLVTSGFDGSIYTWDINKYSEGDVQFRRVFHTDGLMRTKLSPDASKLILCTTNGYLMVIHDLNLHMLTKDLQGFAPNAYRLMQLRHPDASFRMGNYNHLFTARRNRVELISDFPVGNEAEVISSLQVHPQGWCVLSRNTSSDEHTEWTCVHDIQDFVDRSKDDPLEEQPDGSDAPAPTENGISAPTESGESSQGESSSEPDGAFGAFSRPMIRIRFNCRQRTPPEAAANGEGVQNGAEPRALDVTFRIPVTSFEALEAVAASIASAQRSSGQGPSNGGLADNGSRVWTPRVPRNASGNRVELQDGHSSSSEQEDEDSDSVPVELGEGSPHFIRTNRSLWSLGFPPASANERDSADGGTGGGAKVVCRKPRLTHFISEPNVGRGFIKELCFSTDGRLVCSPFGHGVRLLAFNSRCSELSDCVPDKPTKLYEVASNVCHPYVVVSTKFSPTHCLLTSGCLNGKICFYQPLFG